MAEEKGKQKKGKFIWGGGSLHKITVLKKDWDHKEAGV